MSDQHDQIKQDLAAYALGALEPDEVATVEEHLKGCEECQALFDEYLQTTALLPMALDITSPPAGAGERLLATARASATVETETPHRAERIGTPSTPWKLIAAASLLLAMILGGTLIWTLAGDDDDSMPGDGERVVALSGSPDAPEASGHLILDESDEWAMLIVANLPAIQPGRAYQFWFVAPDGERVSGAVFNPGPEGGAVVEIDVPENVGDYERIGVTEEPEGGSEGPTGTNVLGGLLRASG